MGKNSLCYNKHMRDRKVRAGFTLVELSLSIVFIAILSVAVAIIITNAISSYHRGVILNQVNTTGMEIVDDIRASIQNSPARSVRNECSSVFEEGKALEKCKEDGGREFVVVTRNTDIVMGSRKIENVPIYGALCTGSYSYLWKSGYYYSEDVKKDDLENLKVRVKYKYEDSDEYTADNIRLLKIHDKNRAVCIVAGKAKIEDENNEIEVDIDLTKSEYGGILDEKPYDLMDVKSGLALYDLNAAEPASSTSTNNMFYTVSFILGTLSGGINVMSNGDFCTPPGDSDSGVENFNYCAINKFNFAAEANGG